VSDSERPDMVAFQELEHLIHSLADEMAGWRRRAHEAEAKLKSAPPAPAGRVNAAALERENRELRERLDAAKARTKQLLEKLRFLRQQQESEAHR
jgi:predicted RNase H-like nuclease (RuvC/YqgF family)